MTITIGMYVDDNPHTPGHTADVADCALIDRVLVTGTDQARAAAGQMEKAEFVEDHRTLLGDPDIPALIVLTNPRDAGRLTLEAVKAGTWVYAEKPGARTADEMARIVAACERRGAHLTPCYARRTFLDTLEIKRLVERGAVGELWSFQANWIASQAELRGVEHWLFDAALAGGGILSWLGCHWIDLIRFVTGERIVAVSAMCRTADERISVEDVACLSVRLEGGAVGMIRCGYLLNPFDGYDDHHLMTAWEGSDGSITHFPHGAATLRVRSRADGNEAAPGPREIAVERPARGGYAPTLLADFVCAVEQGRAPLVTEADALHVLRVIEAAHESARTGTEQQVG